MAGPAPIHRNLPTYTDLGARVVNEIPYDLEEGLDANGVQNVEFIQVDQTDRFDIVNYKDLTAQQNTDLENKLGPGKVIGRVGWLQNHAIFTPPNGTLPPFSTDEEPLSAAIQAQLYYITDAAGNRLKAPDGSGTDLQFTKVMLIPYRWRRKGQGRTETRQTYLAVCYSGPSSQ